MNKEEFEDYQKLSGEITEKLDNTSTYENWLIIQEYVDKLQQENKQLHEIIDKAIEVIENEVRFVNLQEYYKLLEILRGDSNV